MCDTVMVDIILDNARSPRRFRGAPFSSEDVAELNLNIPKTIKSKQVERKTGRAKRFRTLEIWEISCQVTFQKLCSAI